MIIFFEHFQLIFDNFNVTKRQKNKTKNSQLFFCTLLRIIKFFFLILQRKTTLESKVAPINRNSSAFLLHTKKTFYNVELFFIFWQTFLKLIVATKLKTILLKQSVVILTSWHTQLYVLTLKILYEYWLNTNACLNIV